MFSRKNSPSPASATPSTSGPASPAPPPPLRIQYKSRYRGENGKRVRINISGEYFEVLEKTLQKYPEALLASPEREFFYKNGEYYFERNPRCFQAIMTYYQCGILNLPVETDVRIFIADLNFFGFVKQQERFLPEKLDDEERLLPKNKTQAMLWELMEHPDTGFAAKIVAMVSMGVIVFSVGMFCLETLPFFREDTYELELDINGTTIGKTVSGYQTKLSYQGSFKICEGLCIAWFTIEYLLRLLGSPQRMKFIMAPLNLFDVVAIIPFYISLIISSVGEKNKKKSGLVIFRILRLSRAMRVFKLSRHCSGLKVLGYTLIASLQELALLGFFLGMGIILFASAVFFCEEQEDETTFVSIPAGFWWAIVTMTTVGYGDMYPVTFAGQLVGSICVLTGVLATSFPVPVIVNNFAYYYELESATPETLNELYLQSPLASAQKKNLLNSPAFGRRAASRRGSQESKGSKTMGFYSHENLQDDMECTPLRGRPTAREDSGSRLRSVSHSSATTKGGCADTKRVERVDLLSPTDVRFGASSSTSDEVGSSGDVTQLADISIELDALRRRQKALRKSTERLDSLRGSLGLDGSFGGSQNRLDPVQGSKHPSGSSPKLLNKKAQKNGRLNATQLYTTSQLHANSTNLQNSHQRLGGSQNRLDALRSPSPLSQLGGSQSRLDVLQNVSQLRLGALRKTGHSGAVGGSHSRIDALKREAATGI